MDFIFQDIMTDLAAVSDYLGKVELENRHQTKAHKGMIRAADYIRKRLVDKEILDLVKAKVRGSTGVFIEEF